MKNNFENVVIFPVKERVKVDHQNWPPDDYPLHYHDYYEMEIVTQGKGRQIFNGTEFELNYKDLYLLRPLDYHKIHSDDISFANVTMKEDVVSKWLIKKLSSFRNPVVYHLTDEEYNTFLNLFDLLKKELNDTENKSSVSPIETTVELLLILFLRLDKDGTNSIEDDVVSKTIYYLQKNNKFTEKVTLDEIAKYVGYSKYYTSSLFHKQHGTTIQDFIINMRIEYAKKLIIESNYTITEIIMECGFTSPSNFYSKFVKSVGCSPLKFKQENRHNSKEE